MKLRTRRWFSFVEHHLDPDEGPPLRKAAVAAVVENPYAGRKVEDLQPIIAASEDLGREMGKLLLETFGQYEIQSYGKGGIAGLAGDQEHANALLTTTFANPLREAVGGGKAWNADRHPAGIERRALCPLALRRHDRAAARRAAARRSRRDFLRRQPRPDRRACRRTSVRGRQGAGRADLTSTTALAPVTAE
jgi:hypothetical protein